MSLKEASPSVKESGEDELDMFVNSEFFKNTTSNSEKSDKFYEKLNESKDYFLNILDESSKKKTEIKSAINEVLKEEVFKDANIKNYFEKSDFIEKSLEEFDKTEFENFFNINFMKKYDTLSKDEKCLSFLHLLQDYEYIPVQQYDETIDEKIKKQTGTDYNLEDYFLFRKKSESDETTVFSRQQEEEIERIAEGVAQAEIRRTASKDSQKGGIPPIQDAQSKLGIYYSQGVYYIKRKYVSYMVYSMFIIIYTIIQIFNGNLMDFSYKLFSGTCSNRDSPGMNAIKEIFMWNNLNSVDNHCKVINNFYRFFELSFYFGLFNAFYNFLNFDASSFSVSELFKNADSQISRSIFGMILLEKIFTYSFCLGTNLIPFVQIEDNIQQIKIESEDLNDIRRQLEQQRNDIRQILARNQHTLTNGEELAADANVPALPPIPDSPDVVDKQNHMQEFFKFIRNYFTTVIPSETQIRSQSATSLDEFDDETTGSTGGKKKPKKTKRRKIKIRKTRKRRFSKKK